MFIYEKQVNLFQESKTPTAFLCISTALVLLFIMLTTRVPLSCTSVEGLSCFEECVVIMLESTVYVSS